MRNLIPYAAILQRRAACLLAFTCLALPAIARGNIAPALPDIATRQGECMRPSFQTGKVEGHGPGGYGVEVQGERYWVALENRLVFPLLDKDGRDMIAQVKLERAPSGAFEEQAAWRERWLEDVAARAGVRLQRQSLEGRALLLTVNKKALTGKAFGISLLVDPGHQAFVQWDWNILSRYANPEDAAAMQKAVWERMLPCSLKF